MEAANEREGGGVGRGKTKKQGLINERIKGEEKDRLRKIERESYRVTKNGTRTHISLPFSIRLSGSRLDEWAFISSPLAKPIIAVCEPHRQHSPRRTWPRNETGAIPQYIAVQPQSDKIWHQIYKSYLVAEWGWFIRALYLLNSL